ncbi:uncharacterized protein FOMMEDRAFT_71096, partial [Fomitiporia mediterranea MF3/22]|uniref:uncharacterized protein n=1 Tax=Fomitiporia mediterranea (strain MF3/22) TaxID=694068 RepID=UPI0004407D30
ISVRPWSPSERWAFPKPPPSTTPSTVYYRTPSPPTQSRQSDRGPVSPLPPLSAVTPHPENNPFADPDASATHEDATTVHTDNTNATEGGLIGSVEHIRRPFIPTLSDEVAVHRGDVVRVLQAFDDGWVQVEKISVANAGTAGERGLIPIDCLREAGEALPSFLASKRVSSY